MRLRCYATALFCVLFVSAAGCAQLPPKAPPATPDKAFATVSGRRNDGWHYHPFYGLVITPHAVVAKGKVYCAFQNTRGRPIVMAYDIGEKTWAGPVTASDRGLGGDDHGNPSVYVDHDGRIHIFYGCHGRAMRHTRSAEPYDISKWEEQKSPTPHATYPQTMRMADGMALFYRAGGHMAPWTMRTSSDNCKTWSKPKRIIEMRVKPRDPRAAAYCAFFPGPDNKTIHCFWNFKDDDPRRRPKAYRNLHEAVYRYNMYYIRRDAEGVWRNAAGDKLPLPVSKATADKKCVVFDSGKQFAYPRRVAADDDNRPYIKLSVGVQDWAPPRRVIIPRKPKYATFRDGEWRIADKRPQNWPPEVVEIIRAPGFRAFGETDHGRWFIFYRRFKKNVSRIFLYGSRTGYVSRPADDGK